MIPLSTLPKTNSEYIPEKKAEGETKMESWPQPP